MRTDAALKGGGDRVRLFEYLLGHVVAKRALVCCIMLILKLLDPAFYRLAGPVKNRNTCGGEFNDFPFLEKDEAISHWPQGLGVGCDEILANPEAKHQRAACPCSDDAIRMIQMQDRDGVRAFKLADGLADAAHEISARLNFAMQQMRNDLRVSFGSELVSILTQRVAK